MVRILQDLERDPLGYDRHWTELIRLFEKGSSNEQMMFGSHRGVAAIVAFFNCYLDGTNPSSSARLVASALNVVRMAARCNFQMSSYIIGSRMAPLLLCLLAQRLEVSSVSITKLFLLSF